MNKKGLQIQSGLFAIVAVSMMVIAAGVIIADWNIIYDSGLTYDLGTDYSKLSEVSGTAESQRGSMSTGDISVSESGDFTGTSIRAAFGVLNTIYTSFNVVFGNNGMLDSITERFGLPDYIRQGIVTLMILAITFALIMIFFGRRNI